MRAVEQDAHGATTNKTSDRNSHEPRENQKTNSLPVNSLEGTVAQTNTDGSASDAHGSRDREGVLREDEDGDGSTKFHGGTTRRRVVGDLVTHDLHDVVSVGDETNADGQRHDGNLPHGDGSLLLGSLTGRPGGVHDGPGTDGVTDIVGAMGEGGSAGSDDLDKGVEVLDLVGVLFGVVVDAGHAASLGGAFDADLGSVDVVVGAVEEGGDEEGGGTLEEGDDVGGLVDGAGAHGVLVQGAHGPGEGTAAGAEPGVVLLEGLGHETLVALLVALGEDELLVRSVVLVILGHDGVLGVLEVVVVVVALELGGAKVKLLLAGLGAGTFLVILDDSVVGDLGLLGISGGRALEQERTVDDMSQLEGVVLLDDLGVDVGDEEERRKHEQAKAATDSDGSNVPSRLGVELQVGGALVDNGESADRAGNEEKERRGPDSPGDGVLAHMHNQLDQHEGDGSKGGRDGRRHAQTGKDGSETSALVPAPLDAAGANGGNANTSERRDEGVGGRDVGGVARAPHHPDGGTGGGTGEGEELDAGVVLEGRDGDDAVLDGGGGTGSDGQGAEEFEDETEDHGLSVCD